MSICTAIPEYLTLMIQTPCLLVCMHADLVDIDSNVVFCFFRRIYCESPLSTINSSIKDVIVLLVCNRKGDFSPLNYVCLCPRFRLIPIMMKKFATSGLLLPIEMPLLRVEIKTGSDVCFLLFNEM